MLCTSTCARERLPKKARRRRVLPSKSGNAPGSFTGVVSCSPPAALERAIESPCRQNQSLRSCVLARLRRWCASPQDVDQDNKQTVAAELLQLSACCCDTGFTYKFAKSLQVAQAGLCNRESDRCKQNATVDFLKLYES